jgi:hypothetical protein
MLLVVASKSGAVVAVLELGIVNWKGANEAEAVDGRDVDDGGVINPAIPVIVDSSCLAGPIFALWR